MWFDEAVDGVENIARVFFACSYNNFIIEAAQKRAGAVPT